MTRRKRPVVEWVATAMCLCLLVPARVALGYGQSSNPANRIGIYDIQYYGQQYDAGSSTYTPWKPQVPVSDTRFRTETLYNLFNCTDTTTCGYSTSFRLTDANVSVSNMNSAAGINSIASANMVFFYGHNITPRVYDALYGSYQPHSFDAWFPAGTVTGTPNVPWGPINGSWTQASLCSGYPGQTGCYRSVFEWGTYSTPFYYHWTNSQNNQYGIQNAAWQWQSHAVFYAYNPLTSMLTNKDWYWGDWPYANTVGQTSPSGYGSGQIDGTEFFVANGCEAVPVAGWVDHYPSSSGATWITQGIDAWRGSWGDTLHVVLGHTEATRTDTLPNLQYYWVYLTVGLGVIQSYFLAHSGNSNDPSNFFNYAPSAIAPRATVPGGLDVYAYDSWYPRRAAPTPVEIINNHYKTWFMAAGTTDVASFQW